MYTLSIATSRGRTAITAVETLAKLGQREPNRAVTYADRLPPDATPAHVHHAVTVLSDRLKDSNGGAEPLVVLMYGGGGTALFELLLDDKRAGLRERSPLALTTASVGNDGRAGHISRALLASILFREFTKGRIAFASGMLNLDRLRAQMDSFEVIETAAGNLKFGDESLDVYDDQVVSLMLPVQRRGWGHGPQRVIDLSGAVWPSAAEMRARTGSAASLPHAVTTETSYGSVRVTRP